MVVEVEIAGATATVIFFIAIHVAMMAHPLNLHVVFKMMQLLELSEYVKDVNLKKWINQQDVIYYCHI